jgi:hypothetical protein
MRATPHFVISSPGAAASSRGESAGTATGDHASAHAVSSAPSPRVPGEGAGASLLPAPDVDQISRNGSGTPKRIRAQPIGKSTSFTAQATRTDVVTGCIAATISSASRVPPKKTPIMRPAAA